MNRLPRIMLIVCVAICLSLTASAQMSTDVGGFTMRFVGVQYDWDAPSSTWTYGLTWNDGYHSPNTGQQGNGNNPALSHLTIDLCDEPEPTITNVQPGPPTFSISTSEGQGNDPGDWGYVIKWDVQSGSPLTMGEEFFFSFTLDDTYAVVPTTFFAKAGQDANQGLIYGPGCMIADPEIDVTKSCTSDVFVGDVIAYDIVVTNTGNVPLTGVVVDDPLVPLHEEIATLAPGESETFSVSVPTTASGEVTNTVTATGAYFGNVVDDQASCTTKIWELEVAKTASTYYTREWAWTMDKTVEEDSVDICGQSSATLHYTVTAARTSTDSDYNVSGSITVHNPAPISAPLAAVTDNFEGYGVTVGCGVSFPFDLPGGGFLTCTYSLDLASATDGTNVATATLGSGTSFMGSTSVVFGDPTTEIDPVVTITDAIECPEGFTCGTTPFPLTVGDDATIPFDVEVTKAGAECNSYFTVTNTATLHTSTGSLSDSAATEIYTCECGFGCTLTIGYWKTHAGFTGRNADSVSQYLPIWLGDPYGTYSVEITTAEEAVAALSMDLGHPSNGITKLYAQLLGAKLNIANGSSWGDISREIKDADEFLAAHDFEYWNTAKKNEKKQILGWMTTFDAFNNGDIGPGHCD